MKYPNSNREKATLYFSAMHEVRERLRSIDALVASDWVPLFVEEFCQLQLRLICECIAVACLAAQGDFKTHKAFTERHEPGAIFKALKGLYPGFFPSPSLMIKNGPNSWHFDDVGHGNAVTAGEIVEIWNRSGNRMHRGSAKRFLKDVINTDLLEVTRKKEKIWNLILDHIVVLSDRTSRLHVSMDRYGEAIRCHFLIIDSVRGTAAVEVFDASIAGS